jgi:hypothetical protein
MACAGSPGTNRMMKKTSTDIASMAGIVSRRRRMT